MNMLAKLAPPALLDDDDVAVASGRAPLSASG